MFRSPILAFVSCLSLVTAVLYAADGDPCRVATQHRDRATAYYRHHDLASAISELRQAKALCPTEPFFTFMLGNALYRSGQLQESAEAYQTFVKSRPGHFEARMCLGFASFELGQRTQAVEEWEVAARLEPQSPFAHAALAVGLYSIGHFANAVIQYQGAIGLDGRYAQPEQLGIDIRWKPESRRILEKVKQLSN